MAETKPRKRPNDTKAERHREENWCLRCLEQEHAPTPDLALLNTRHESFARGLVLKNMTPRDAYKAAGFTCANRHTVNKSAGNLKKQLLVQNRIRFLQGELIEIDAKTRTWVDDNLREIVERTMQGKKHLGKDGRPDGDWVFDAANAHKALFSMGKDRGMFVDKIEVRSIDAELHDKTDSEVLEVVASTFSELGRPVCIQIMEKVFGLEYHGGSTGSQDADSGDASASKPVPAVH